jgi:hypothetical protein
MKQRIYVDTSVLGGVYDPEFEEWSSRLMREFNEGIKILVISDLTLRELESAPEHVQEVFKEIPEDNIEFVLFKDEAKELSEKYMKTGLIPSKSRLDAQHIALATIKKVNVLVSWNFKHIVNLDKIRIYNSVNLKYGYPLIEIRAPREILNDKGKD